MTDLHSNREENDERRIEEAIHSYGHADFDKLIQEDINRGQEETIRSYSQADFDKLVQEDSNRRQEETIHSYGHADFDKLVQEDVNRRQETGLHNSLEDFDKIVQEDEFHHNYLSDNIFVKKVGIHHSSNHDDFEKLVQEDGLIGNRRDKVVVVGASHEDFDERIQEAENNLIQKAENDLIQKAENDLMQEAENNENSIVLRETNDFQDANSFATQKISQHPSKAGTVTEAPTNSNNAHPHEMRNQYIAGFALAAFLGFFFLCINRVVRRRRAKRKMSDQVYTHLAEFDVEDMELTKAVTGGWHGTYKNRLAEGFNDVDDDDTGSLDDDDDDFETLFCGYSSDDNTIVFMEEGLDLLVADRNVYLASDEEYEDSDSDDYDDDDEDICLAANDDLFTPVETEAV